MGIRWEDGRWVMSFTPGTERIMVQLKKPGRQNVELVQIYLLH